MTKAIISNQSAADGFAADKIPDHESFAGCSSAFFGVSFLRVSLLSIYLYRLFTSGRRFDQFYTAEDHAMGPATGGAQVKGGHATSHAIDYTL